MEKFYSDLKWIEDHWPAYPASDKEYEQEHHTILEFSRYWLRSEMVTKEIDLTRDQLMEVCCIAITEQVPIYLLSFIGGETDGARIITCVVNVLLDLFEDGAIQKRAIRKTLEHVRYIPKTIIYLIERAASLNVSVTLKNFIEITNSSYIPMNDYYYRHLRVSYRNVVSFLKR